MNYNLNLFCNIITSLRKQNHWSQIKLAEHLDISPQSVSKWECGIGYPDITMFPKIAELFHVSIDFLFGKTSEELQILSEYQSSFSNIENIQISLGNICRIEFFEEKTNNCYIHAIGDNIFLNYFDIENENGTLFINIKNPTASTNHWKLYNRNGYEKENYIQIFTQCKNIHAINYLDLYCTQGNNKNGNHEILCYKL